MKARDRIDPVKAGKTFKANQTAFFMDTRKWRSFKTKFKITWMVVPFSADKVDEIPQEPGLYAFVVSCGHDKLPAHGYVMYVGQSGHGTSNADLRGRFKQYLRDQRVGSSRPAVDRMLTEFAEDLRFCFTALPKAKPTLKTLETKLISAIIPPVNHTDFEAEVSIARRAAF